MADRKENELTKANNFEYVRALDANGNSIQISKADLVSVLEGLIGEVSLQKNGLQKAGTNALACSMHLYVLKIKYSSEYTVSLLEMVYYHVGSESAIDVLPNFVNKGVKARYRIKGNTRLKIYIDYNDNSLYFMSEESSSSCTLYVRNTITNSVITSETIDKSSFSTSGLTELIISD